MPQLPSDFLAQPVSSILTGRPLITIAENTRLRPAMNYLIHNKVSGAPVRRENAAADSNNKADIVGFIDVMDILEFMMATQEATRGFGRGFEAVFETAVSVAEHSVKDLISQEGTSTVRYDYINTTATIQDALNLMADNKLQRLLVLDGDAIVGVVSQTALLKAVLHSDLCDDCDLFNLELSQVLIATQDPTNPAITVNEPLFNPSKPVYTLLSSDKAVNAFKIIQKYRVSGVAVVDERANLVGNISQRDIRSLMEKDENYENLFSSAAEYLESIRSNADSTVRPEVVTCAPCDTISFICAQMEKYSVHRVFISSRKVVKGQVIQKPVGIVTMSDLIKLFAGRGKGSLLGGTH